MNSNIAQFKTLDRSLERCCKIQIKDALVESVLRFLLHKNVAGDHTVMLFFC